MTGMEIVYKAVDEVNAQSDNPVKIEKSPATALLGDGSSIDSLQLVNLIAAIEQVVASELGKSIMLLDESVFSAADKPLETLGNLAAHVEKLVA
jgi:acyl carrier protein